MCIRDSLESDTHGSKYNGELLVFSANLRLSRDLCRKLCMRKTGCGEDRKFLSTYQGVQSVNSGYTGLDKLLRIDVYKRQL